MIDDRKMEIRNKFGLAKSKRSQTEFASTPWPALMMKILWIAVAIGLIAGVMWIVKSRYSVG